jgi:YggT family protein
MPVYTTTIPPMGHFYLYRFIDFAFQALYVSMLIRILLSWIPHDPFHPIISAIYKITDPILIPFRNMIPPIGGIDISAIFAFMALGLIQKLIYFFVFN